MIKKLSAIFCRIILFLFILEICLRLGGLIFLKTQAWQNELNPKSGNVYRILCVGDSTTALGGMDSYPRQLEEVLNERQDKIQFSVINKGVPGMTVLEAAVKLEAYLEEYHPHMVITMLGAEVTGERNEERIREKSLRPWERLLIVNLWQNGIVSGAGESLKQSKGFRSMVQLLRRGKTILKPKDWRAWEKLGYNYFSWKDYTHAADAWEKMYALNPAPSGDADGPFINIAILYLNAPINKEAGRWLERNIKASPQSFKSYSYLAGVYRNDGDNDKAMAILRQGIEANPQPRLFADIGDFLLKQGKIKEAEAIFQQALAVKSIQRDRLEGVEVYLYEQLQSIYQKIGRINDAERLDKILVRHYARMNEDYQKIKQILASHNVRFAAMQYPMRDVNALKKQMMPHEGILFVDNNAVFRKAVDQGSYAEYFGDNCGGDFGHGTRKGNHLIAENIAAVILPNVDVFLRQLKPRN